MEAAMCLRMYGCSSSIAVHIKAGLASLPAILEATDPISPLWTSALTVGRRDVQSAFA